MTCDPWFRATVWPDGGGWKDNLRSWLRDFGDPEPPAAVPRFPRERKRRPAMVLFYGLLVIAITFVTAIISFGAVSVPALSVVSQGVFFAFIALFIVVLLASSLRSRT